MDDYEKYLLVTYMLVLEKSKQTMKNLVLIFLTISITFGIVSLMFEGDWGTVLLLMSLIAFSITIGLEIGRSNLPYISKKERNKIQEFKKDLEKIIEEEI